MASNQSGGWWRKFSSTSPTDGFADLNWMTRSQITPHSVRPEHENDLMEAAVDCKRGILTGVDVYSANEKESLLVLRHLERQINLGIPMSRLALDRGYETGAVHRGWSFWALPDISPQFSSPIHLRNMDSPTIHSSTHSSVWKEFLLHTTG